MLHLIDTYKERYAVAPEATGSGSGLVDRPGTVGAVDILAFMGVKTGNKKAMQRAIDRLLTGDTYQRIQTVTDNCLFALWGRLTIAVIAILDRPHRYRA